MSMKRQATTELNHDNWDTEDPEEHEEMGSFKAAPQEVLEKRVIRTAKRRNLMSSDEAKKNIFSGFGSVNKTQSTSFDFLANLTNGNKSSNIIPTTTEATVTSTLFANKPLLSPIEGKNETSLASVKQSFALTPQTSNIFGSANNKSVFASKPDSTVKESPFKKQPVSGSGDTSNVEITKVTTASTAVSTSNVISIFGTSDVTTPIKTVSSTTNSLLFKTQPTLNKSGSANTSISTSSALHVDKSKDDEKADELKNQYYSKLQGLNVSVSDWIKKHVDETPLCILTPIFKDYEKYLKEIQGEYDNPIKVNTDEKVEAKPKSILGTDTSSTTSVFASNNNLLSTGSSLFTKEKSKPALFSPSVNSTSTPKSTGFSFEKSTTSIKSPTLPVTLNSGFTFGIKPSSQPSTPITSIQSNVTTVSTFVLNTSTVANGAKPFSFSNDKPFSFGTNVNSPVKITENKNDDNNGEESDDTCTKVEYTPIVEENSVFDKRCKIFVKKDASYVDKGVGTLYIKKIEGNEKYQLLVRANTSLGNVLINLRLTSSIPTQKVGKNNVMIVCIPTPDSKPPPTSVLIRVKTSEEADDLIEALNKHKK